MSRDELNPFRSEDRTVNDEAADWFGRHDGGLNPAEERELQAWLDADPRHARAFAQLAAASRALDQLSAFRPIASNVPNADLPLVARPKRGRTRPRRARLVAFSLAAAAVLTFACIGGWHTLTSRPSFTESAVTDVGGLRQLTLPDGSAIELNTNSAVEVAFSRRERHVTLLRGEAHFIVAKDVTRPFTVSANNVAVRAVGTAFKVRLHSANIDVLVTEGRVRLNDAKDGNSLLPEDSAASEPPVLAAGHRAVIRTDGTGRPSGVTPAVVTLVEEKEISRELAWQQKRLEFGPTPLGLIIAEFNRYNQHQLVLADTELNSLSVGGSFELKGGHETLVRLLESSFGIKAERRANETLLRRN